MYIRYFWCINTLIYITIIENSVGLNYLLILERNRYHPIPSWEGTQDHERTKVKIVNKEFSQP